MEANSQYELHFMGCCISFELYLVHLSIYGSGQGQANQPSVNMKGRRGDDCEFHNKFTKQDFGMVSKVTLVFLCSIINKRFRFRVCHIHQNLNPALASTELAISS